MERASEKRGGPIEIPLPISLLFIPILAVAALLSYPVGAVMVIYHRHTERHFVQAMRRLGRVMEESDFRSCSCQKAWNVD